MICESGSIHHHKYLVIWERGLCGGGLEGRWCGDGRALVGRCTVPRVNRWAGKVLLYDEGYVSSPYYYIRSI